jgi:hypothetical protein
VIERGTVAFFLVAKLKTFCTLIVVISRIDKLYYKPTVWQEGLNLFETAAL